MKNFILIFTIFAAVFNIAVAIFNATVGNFGLLPINITAAALCIICSISVSR
jgi:hypothetical protein